MLFKARAYCKLPSSLVAILHWDHVSSRWEESRYDLPEEKSKNHFPFVLWPSSCDWWTFFGLSQVEDSKLMILSIYHCIVEMRYLSEMRIYFKAHFALLSDAQYWANTSNALKCCNRFTHNGRSNGNLAHKATLPLKLQYHNPAKSSFVCVSAIHPPSPPERWRSPRIGRQLLEPGRYYGGALHLQLRLLHHYCCSSVFCRCYATTLAQLFTSTTTAVAVPYSGWAKDWFLEPRVQLESTDLMH